MPCCSCAGVLSGSLAKYKVGTIIAAKDKKEQLSTDKNAKSLQKEVANKEQWNDS